MNKDQVRSFGLDATELAKVIDRAKQRFSQIKEKYPAISAYVVFAKGGSQANVKSGLVEILETFPSFFSDSDKKVSALQQLEQKNILSKQMRDATENKIGSKERSRLDRMENDLREAVKSLEINFSAQIELRFDELDYDLIRQLRSDALVDHDLTPQIGGIRIVLGTIYDFSEGWNGG